MTSKGKTEEPKPQRSKSKTPDKTSTDDKGPSAKEQAVPEKDNQTKKEECRTEKQEDANFEHLEKAAEDLVATLAIDVCIIKPLYTDKQISVHNISVFTIGNRNLGNTHGNFDVGGGELDSVVNRPEESFHK